jgi:chromosome segregation ATPase
MIPDSLWASEADAGVGQQMAHEPAEELAPDDELEPQVEDQAKQKENQEVTPPVALAVSSDDFSALEDRVMRAVAMLKHERQARAAAEVRIAEAEERIAKAEDQLGPAHTQLNQQTQLNEQLQNEVSNLRAERDTVRHRVERLLGQLDSLEI